MVLSHGAVCLVLRSVSYITYTHGNTACLPSKQHLLLKEHVKVCMYVNSCQCMQVVRRLVSTALRADKLEPSTLNNCINVLYK
jgi:hypothetical protein